MTMQDLAVEISAVRVNAGTTALVCTKIMQLHFINGFAAHACKLTGGQHGQGLIPPSKETVKVLIKV